MEDIMMKKPKMVAELLTVVDNTPSLIDICFTEALTGC
jgi:hypothetical protein